MNAYNHKYDIINNAIDEPLKYQLYIAQLKKSAMFPINLEKPIIDTHIRTNDEQNNYIYSEPKRITRINNIFPEDVTTVCITKYKPINSVVLTDNIPITHNIEYIKFDMHNPDNWLFPYDIKRLSIPDHGDMCVFMVRIQSIPAEHITITDNGMSTIKLFVKDGVAKVIIIAFKGNSKYVDGHVIMGYSM